MTSVWSLRRLRQEDYRVVVKLGNVAQLRWGQGRGEREVGGEEMMTGISKYVLERRQHIEFVGF